MKRTKTEIEHGRGWVLVKNVELSPGLKEKLSSSSTKIYREEKEEI